MTSVTIVKLPKNFYLLFFKDIPRKLCNTNFNLDNLEVFLGQKSDLN